MRGATRHRRCCTRSSRFQSTHPVRGATVDEIAFKVGDVHFNPRTPCGVRRCRSRPTRRSRRTFQSTHPVRGATRRGAPYQRCRRISIHAPRAGCDVVLQRHRQPLRISIHAPRAGCDVRSDAYARSHQDFNPRTPCGVRLDPARISCFCANFNPRTPCGVRPHQSTTAHKMGDFNPRTPCGVRLIVSKVDTGGEPFQSTYPVRGATRQRYRHDHPAHISIHVPRAGCDRPRSSCPDPARAISIHVPRAGCDGKFDDFNPLNLHKRYKRVLDRPKSTSEQGKNKAKLAYIHVFTVFLGGAKVPELSARFYFAPNTVRLSARPWRHSPLWHRNARCGCDTYPQGSKSADCLRIHP